MKYARYLPAAQRRETWEEMITRNRDMHIESFPKLTSEIENGKVNNYANSALGKIRDTN